MVPFLLLHSFSYMLGTAICFWCAGRFLLRQTKPLISPVLLIPLLGDGFVFAQALPFLEVPGGTGIRPMGWVFYMVSLAMGLTVFGLAYVAGQFRKQPNKALWAMGLVLSLLPLPLAMTSLRLMAALKGFELEP